ncbi:U3 small nucleolar RNA-associated protein 18 homolog [Galleria mellonella]|uniref:U3 small nucleolar RNA-associated protein 18 homolog n=1 Tax=Galleria mellonella TaxID=7137 RepID=A0A6J1WKX0_GALME|nr:U3 small nucleolar RNA-associated protein 18 homolog [Galleria mellonella]
MKRKGSNLDVEESRLSGLLFNKSKRFVEKIKNEEDQHLPDLNLKPAWIDEDDEQLTSNNNTKNKTTTLYAEKLKHKYESLMGTPNWAKIKDKLEANLEDSDILRKVGHIQKKKGSLNLSNNFLQLRKLQNINSEFRKQGQIISCVEFHPKLSVALVAGLSGVVSLFSVGGDTNNQLHSFKFNNVSAVQFSPDGSEAYLASKANHYYCMYDLVNATPKMVQLPHCVKRPLIFKLSPNGKYIATSDSFDEVHIICSNSKELIKSLKHNYKVACVTFSHNSEQVYCYCIQGEITIWDLSTFRAVKKFYDNGCINASCISNSSCGKLLATGSQEGIVNVYETNNITTSEPFPMKTISNLTTKITDITFNNTTEILAISSYCFQNAVKLIHIPSYHVFSNFPQQADNYNHIQCVRFSPNSGYMAMGNNKGAAYLYRLKHYKNY